MKDIIIFWLIGAPAAYLAQRLFLGGQSISYKEVLGKMFTCVITSWVLVLIGVIIGISEIELKGFWDKEPPNWL